MIEQLCLCPNCYNARDASDDGTPCEICGHTFVVCLAGPVDDPGRKPLMDADGDLQTRAPQWWIEQHKRLSKET